MQIFVKQFLEKVKNSKHKKAEPEQYPDSAFLCLRIKITLTHFNPDLVGQQSACCTAKRFAR